MQSKGSVHPWACLSLNAGGRQFSVVEFVRERVDLPGVTTQLINSDTGDHKVKIGLIRIPSFYYSGRSVSEDTAKALDELIEAEVDAVLIDLRNNAGGSLDEAVDIAGLFVDGPVVTTKNQRGFRRDVIDDDDGVAYDGPFALLLNRHSASASEVLAAAIQDYRRGVLLGDSQTFGKGSAAIRIDVGRFLRRSNEKLGVLAATSGKVYRPTGESTHLEGVKSDIVLPSLTDGPTVGEAAMDYVLARDSIEPSEFALTEFVTKEIVRELNKRSEARRRNSDDFHRIREAKKRWLALRNRHQMDFSVPLLQSDEFDQLRKLMDELSGGVESKRFGSNAYEAEVIQIVGDLVELSSRRD